MPRIVTSPAICAGTCIQRTLRVPRITRKPPVETNETAALSSKSELATQHLCVATWNCIAEGSGLIDKRCTNILSQAGSF